MPAYFESGFFVREKAWHGLGTVLDDAPDTAKALALAGLDWEVETVPVQAIVDGEAIPAPDSRAMVRNVHQRDGSLQTDVLGIVGTRYRPLQNSEAFAWFDPLLHEGNCTLEAAGSVKDGRNVWVLARMNDADDANVGSNPEDIVRPYLLLSNSHDGTRAVTVAFTPIRVVCWNTLSAVHRAADAGTADPSYRKVRHTRAAKNTLAGIRDTIDTARRDFTAQALVWNELGAVHLDGDEADRYAIANRRPAAQNVRGNATMAYARRVFGNPAEIKKADKAGDPLPSVRAEKHVWDLLHRGPGSRSAGLTAFGLYMAATHYLDHQNGHTESTRLASSWFGNGANIRARAETEARVLAGIA
ncbi:MAG: DUF932 domain-containing protein [bacterium]|nr:DUF932 domain-containing protein [bacterium]